MQWQFQWGDKVEFLENIEESTGTAPEALQDRPELLEENEYPWFVYSQLARTRLSFDGEPQPIQLSEFMNYCRLFQISRLHAQELWDSVRHIDWLWRKEFAERQAAEHERLRKKAKKG